MAKPKLIVFDLDYTLWPFWVDTHVDPPFKKKSDGKIYDAHGRQVKIFPDVPKMLERLSSDGYKLGVASRTSCTEEARDLVRLFDWDKYFQYKEIYPGCKVTHFERFKQNSGLAYNEMMFFDDEYRNILDVSKLGVTCIFAENGMSDDVLEEGFMKFTEKNGSQHL
ncbi:hypothetical protein ScPMuIL_000247 [Solemya velum]